MCCFGLGFSGISFASLSYEAVMSKPGPGGAVKELGIEQALLLFFSCLGSQGRAAQGMANLVQIFTLSSVSSHSYFPHRLLGLGTW